MTKIAINGFGRIGRSAFKRIINNHPDLEIVAINDLTNNATLAHLLKYDSIYGIYDKVINKKIKNLTESNPEKLPWEDLGADIVLECTGFFATIDGAQKHIQAGAKYVVISAPCKSEKVPHFVLGVNEEKFDCDKNKIISMASCTTNCLAPMAKIINDNFEIESGLMTTIHSYTNDQRLQDAPHKDLRRARAAAISMIPTTTGAAIAVTKTIPELKGKIHGLAIRVPTSSVSLVDFVANVKKSTDIQEVNNIFKQACLDKKLKNILSTEDNPLVSIDFKGNSFSAIVDTKSTMVQNKTLVKVLAWYDNEWGYACRLAEFADYIGKKIN